MPAVNWVADAQGWLFSVMTANTTINAEIGGRVFKGDVPSGTPFPFVTMSVQAAPDTNALGAVRVMSRPRILILVHHRENQPAAEAIYADIDAAIQGRQEIAYGQTFIYGCERLRYDDRPSPSEGVRYNAVGGEYLIDTSSP